MDRQEHTTRVGIFFTLTLIFFPAVALATVGPPIEIKMTVPDEPAVAGEEFSGVFEVHVFKSGFLDDFILSGEGWEIVSTDAPKNGVQVQPGVLKIAFRAIPSNTDNPVELTLTFNGRKASRAYEIGRKYFERAGKPHRLVQIAADSGVVVGPEGRSDDVETQAAGGAIPLRAVGRIVYTRRGIDNSIPVDGDTDDPGDVAPVDVGVDNVRVEFIDDDDIGSETIWTGTTDVNGFFDSGVVQWDDCDAVGCDDPDLVLRIILNTGVVDVTDNSITEDTYTFATEEITDFTGSFHDFGIVTSADSTLRPAFHIFNSIVRVERFIRTRTPHNPPHVQVEWPDGATGAFYQSGPQEIHVSTGRQWNEATHSHEFGHHFLSNFSNTIDPDYCNNFCDAKGGGCNSGNDCEDPGHCIWCPETDHDAWNEGWPNWLADVVTRSYPNDYQFDDGTPYQPLFTRSQENLGTCCQDSQTYGALITEGFLGALLRDIEDSTQDDQDGDGILDSMCLGVDEIFDVVTTLNPTTPAFFILAFASLYPEHADDLWPTAFNIGGNAYVSAFGPDIDPPGVVTVLDSPTHPMGVGNPLPCITVAWEHASDDVTGACNYSYKWTTNPAGVEPDQVADTVDTSGCLLRATAAFGLGEYYFSVKAQDCSNKWSNQWMTYGPFEVTDCNGTGILDLCDISCSHPGYTNCNLGSFCSGFLACGLSDDCQPNLAPDECDLADGTSEDCNETAVPDECEVIFHWADDGVAWTDSDSWEELQTPTVGSDVCIDVPGAATAVILGDVFDIDILACEETLDIFSTAFPRPDVTIDEPSWIRGDLKLHGNQGTLRVNDRLDIDGMFEWTGSNNSQVTKLTGTGETHVFGGMTFAGIAPLDDHRLILEPGSSSTSTGWFLCPGDSTIEIMQGATFDHQGTSTAFNCQSDQLINDGTIIRSAPTGNSNFAISLINNGLVQIQSGELTLTNGSTHTGNVVAESGAIFRMRGASHNFLPASSIVADRVEFTSGAGGSNFIRGTYNVTESTDESSSQTLTFTDKANIINYGPIFLIPRGTVNFDAIIGGPIHFNNFLIGSPPFAGGTARFNSGDPVNFDILSIGPGGLFGPGTFTVNTQFTWRQSATITGPGIIDVDGDATVGAGGGQKTLSDRVMNLHGNTVMDGGFQMIGSSELNVFPEAVVDIRVDSGGAVIGGGVSNVVTIEGTLVKSAGPGTSRLTAPVVNSGNVEVQVGKLEIANTFVQTSGQIFLNGGEFALWWSNPANDPPLQIDGGVVKGSGVISSNQFLTVNNTGGTVTPGTSIGAITIAGNYNQFAGATLEIEIGGMGDGAFDRLEVDGTATLGGELLVMDINGFVPTDGDSFVILTANSVVGEFDTIVMPPQYEIDYDATEVRLFVPLFGDVDDNGALDLLDYGAFQTCFAGPNVPPAVGCVKDADADLDGDMDVDLIDYDVLHDLTFGQ